MDLSAHTTPARLERYAFFWSLARFAIGAVSLFFGAMPVAYRIAGSLASFLLPLFWLVSGAAALYLAYQWYTSGQTVLGGDARDTVAFWIMIVTGLNLGYTAIGSNIGMMLAGNLGFAVAGLVYKATAVLYLLVGYHLYTRWKASGETLFAHPTAPTAPQAPVV